MYISIKIIVVKICDKKSKTMKNFFLVKKVFWDRINFKFIRRKYQLFVKKTY